MNSSYSRKKAVIAFVMMFINFVLSNLLLACDDTLVMLLTAKNPSSEFSKSIRRFMNSLTILGTALKYTSKEDYSTEINSALEGWLAFSQKYMTNPPEEAKNDRQWSDKMSATARKMGEIRRQVNSKQYTEAHNNVLALSNTIGSFFEAVGVSNEKQMFIEASSDLNDLQRLVNSNSIEEAKEKTGKLRQHLESFKKRITQDDLTAASSTATIINNLYKQLNEKKTATEIDAAVNELRTSFEELRSRILMQEWFAFDGGEQEEK